MIDLTYNLSPILKSRLQKTDSLRKEILLTPISPKLEIQIRWEIMIQKIFYSLSLSEINISNKEVIETLSLNSLLRSSEKKLSSSEKEIINYKKAIDFISKNWLISRNNVLVKDLLILYDMLCNGRLLIPFLRLQELLNYIQAREDHPIIQAGLINIGISKLQPFSKGNARVSRLLSYLFLFKYGYDIRGLVEFEKYWFENKESYLDALRIGIEGSSVTIWIEFFSQSILNSLDSTNKKIKAEAFEIMDTDSSFWKLNDRQKSILVLFEQPRISITNKKVQQLFNVSQITASRDLSRLASLGLVFTHGKGRSVYYTKI